MMMMKMMMRVFADFVRVRRSYSVKTGKRKMNIIFRINNIIKAKYICARHYNRRNGKRKKKKATENPKIDAQIIFTSISQWFISMSALLPLNFFKWFRWFITFCSLFCLIIIEVIVVNHAHTNSFDWNNNEEKMWNELDLLRKWGVI